MKLPEILVRGLWAEFLFERNFVIIALLSFLETIGISTISEIRGKNARDIDVHSCLIQRTFHRRVISLHPICMNRLIISVNGTTSQCDILFNCFVFPRLVLRPTETDVIVVRDNVEIQYLRMWQMISHFKGTFLPLEKNARRRSIFKRKTRCFILALVDWPRRFNISTLERALKNYILL